MEKDEEVKVKDSDLGAILTKVVALIIGIGIFVGDKYMHLLEPTLGMEIYGAIAMVALGYTPNFNAMFKK